MKFIILFIISGIYLISPAQETYKIVIDSTSEKPMLIGLTTREAFSDSNFSSWFNLEYESYDPDPYTVEMAAEKLPGKKILIVMATWCSDSRMLVPRLLKILDSVMFPEDQIEIYSVDRTKKIEGLDIDIELVPTIIIYSGDNELGRIVESPQQTLEEDIVEILLNSSY